MDLSKRAQSAAGNRGPKPFPQGVAETVSFSLRHSFQWSASVSTLKAIYLMSWGKTRSDSKQQGAKLQKRKEKGFQLKKDRDVTHIPYKNLFQVDGTNASVTNDKKNGLKLSWTRLGQFDEQLNCY